VGELADLFQCCLWRPLWFWRFVWREGCDWEECQRGMVRCQGLTGAEVERGAELLG